MADSKYGRLFTEADVRKLMHYAVVRGAVEGGFMASDADGNRVDPGAMLLADFECEAARDGGSFGVPLRLTFPADEPLFLLRGTDGQAQFTVRDYAERCEAAGCAPKHVALAREAAGRFHDFVLEHPERVKARPD